MFYLTWELRELVGQEYLKVALAYFAFFHSHIYYELLMWGDTLFWLKDIDNYNIGIVLKLMKLQMQLVEQELKFVFTFT